MRAYKFDHLSDRELLSTLSARVAQERATTAEVVALIAEVEERKLYLPAGYPSMSAYCVNVLRFSEDAAHRRIQVARVARQFPAIFTALAEGGLHLTAILRLVPYLTPERADGLLAEAMNKTRSDIDLMLATRFPRTESLPLVQVLQASRFSSNEPAPARVETLSGAPTPSATPTALPSTRTAPIAADRFLWHLTVGKSAQDKLTYARELLSNQMPTGDMAEVLERGLDALIAQLEKRKFAPTDRPRTGRSSTHPRTIPARVRLEVWRRDQGQCTFVGDTGHRCGSRRFLEYDHIDPVARGGSSTIENLRLRCRAHNQLEAERAYGDGFMRQRRDLARQASGETRSRTAAQEQARDVFVALRGLGFRAEEARRAVEFGTCPANVTLEDRVCAALRYLAPKARVEGRNEGIASAIV